MRNIFMMMLLMVAGLPWLACNRQQSLEKDQTAQEQDPMVAQEQQLPSATPQEAVLQVAEGDVTKVDDLEHLIWIKTSEGKEMKFSFSKDTLVEGAGNTVEGLAKMSGNHLTIHYKTEGDVNLAYRIEVQAPMTQKQKGPMTQKQKGPSAY